jgi:hypothetical protein
MVPSPEGHRSDPSVEDERLLVARQEFGKFSSNRSRAGWGLVRFSAEKRALREKRWPKTRTCPLSAAQGGQSQFRGGQALFSATSFAPRKLGQPPVNGYPASQQQLVKIKKDFPLAPSAEPERSSKLLYCL